MGLFYGHVRGTSEQGARRKWGRKETAMGSQGEEGAEGKREGEGVSKMSSQDGFSYWLRIGAPLPQSQPQPL